MQHRNKNLIVLLVSILLIQLAVTEQPLAAEVYRVSDPSCEYMLSGDIGIGDAEKVEQLVRGYDLEVICLNSQGGSFVGGLELTTLFMTDGIGTYIKKSDGCYSACAIAFLGGSHWGDFRHPSRRIEVGATIGFHAPYLSPPAGIYNETDIASAAKTTVLVLKELIAERESLKISEEFVLDFLLDVRPETRKIETIGELAHSGIDLADYASTFSIDENSLRLACTILFSVHRSYFSDAYSSWEPIFDLDETDYSKLTAVQKIQADGSAWSTVSMQHQWDTPWQTASCAFSDSAPYNGYVSTFLWNNNVGEDPNLDTAIRVIRVEMPTWYFQGSDFRLSDLGN